MRRWTQCPNSRRNWYVLMTAAPSTTDLTNFVPQSHPLRVMQDLAKRISTVSREAKLNLAEEEYIEKFKPHLMDVVYSWSKGATFAQLCKMTNAFEGSI